MDHSLNTKLLEQEDQETTLSLGDLHQLRSHHHGDDPDQIGHHHHDDHDAHEEPVTGEELFFDLVFVAVCIKLANFVKHDMSGRTVAQTLFLFATMFFSWFHCNMVFTRYKLRRIQVLLMFLIILSTLLTAVHSIQEKESGLTNVSEEHGEMVYLNIAVTRVIFAATYLWVQTKQRQGKRLLRRYAVCLVISMVCAVTAAFYADGAAYFWAFGLLVEGIMYPLGYAIGGDEQIAINSAHILERNHLWVILILGESIISLITTAHDTFSWHFYVAVVLGFMLVYTLFQVHMTSAIFTLDRHNIHQTPLGGLLMSTFLFFATAGLLGVGIGLKLLVSYPDGQKYKRDYAWLLSASTTITLACFCFARSVHRWYDTHATTHQLQGLCNFHVAQTFSIVTALAHLALPFLITHKHRAHEPSVFIALTALLAFISLLLERLFKPGLAGILHTLNAVLRSCCCPNRKHHDRGRGTKRLNSQLKEPGAKDALSLVSVPGDQFL
eukprot:m.30112 g.30112  ORF g.30112 m.30112 type:complete len:496 (+) comp9246_c0_seq1:226-1713(+)